MNAPQLALIPVALQETFQPDDLNGLMNIVAEDKVEISTVLVRSVRAYLAAREAKKPATEPAAA